MLFRTYRIRLLDPIFDPIGFEYPDSDVISSPGSYVIRYYPIGSDETQLSDWSTWDLNYLMIGI